MHRRTTWMGIEWMLRTMLGALLGVLISYGLARLLLGPVLAFGGMLGVLVGALLALPIGGVIIALMVGILQTNVLHRHGFAPRSRHGWVWLTVLGWILASLMSIPRNVFPFTSDLSPLVWVVLYGACLAGGLQWLFMRRELPHATRRILSSSLATIMGGWLGIALIGGNQPFMPVLSLLQQHEAIERVHVDNLIAVDSQIFFTVAIEKSYAQHNNRWELWRSDGTAAQTGPIAVGYTLWNTPTLLDIRTLGDQIFLFSSGAQTLPPRTPNSPWFRVWRSDGTPAGTHPIDLPAFRYNVAAAHFERMARLDQRLIFFSHHGSQECRVQITDGTPAGTEVLVDLPDVCAHPILVVNERAVFIHFDRQTATCALWASDGTPAGTRVLTRFAPVTFGACIDHPQTVAGQVLFLRPLPTGHELWTSDGTRAGTARVTTIDPQHPGTAAAPPIDLDRAYVFTVRTANEEATPSCSLWRSDGRAEGTRMVTPHCPEAWRRVNDMIVFTVVDAARQRSLWISDGSSVGTAVVHPDIGSVAYGIEAHVLAATADAFFFQTQRDTTCDIWRSDGTVAGTTRTDLPCTHQLVQRDDTLVFLTRENAVSFTLWQSDKHGANVRRIRRVP